MYTPHDVHDRWTDAIPDLLARCAARWGLRIGEPLEGGHLSRGFACLDSSGSQLVLKLAPPHAAPAVEAAALRTWNGAGAVRLVDWDRAAGVRLDPRGTLGRRPPWAILRRASSRTS